MAPGTPLWQAPTTTPRWRLHALLLGAARFEVARRHPTLPHLRGDELPDSGRRSARLFGQRLVVFAAAGGTSTCVPVPRHAKTFSVRTPLRFALGYALGISSLPRGAPPHAR